MKTLIFLLVLLPACGSKNDKTPSGCSNPCVTDMLRLYNNSTGQTATSEHLDKIRAICKCGEEQ